MNRDRELLRGADDLLVDFDRGFKIFQEFVGGCRRLYDLGPAVTIFGSARFGENHRYYELARATARALAEAGYAVKLMETVHAEGGSDMVLPHRNHRAGTHSQNFRDSVGWTFLSVLAGGKDRNPRPACPYSAKDGYALRYRST